MKIIFFLFPFINRLHIPQTTYEFATTPTRKNETNNDCALIPKKDIPKNPLIWTPKTQYIF